MYSNLSIHKFVLPITFYKIVLLSLLSQCHSWLRPSSNVVRKLMVHFSETAELFLLDLLYDVLCTCMHTNMRAHTHACTHTQVYCFMRLSTHNLLSSLC